MTPGASSHHWDLWLLRALAPAAEIGDLAALLHNRRNHAARLAELPARLRAGDAGCLAEGRRLLADAPELTSGVVVSLQLGPYPCLFEPYLAAGVDLTVLASSAATQRWLPLVEDLARRYGRGRCLQWLDAAGYAAALERLGGALRAGGAVLIFADADRCFDAQAGAVSRRVSYCLPGREVRVSTWLARLLCHSERTLYPVILRWTEDGRRVSWRGQPAQRWTRCDDPATVAQLLHDWIFHEVMADLAQWSGWSLLAAASLAVADGGARDRVPSGLQEDYRRAFALCAARAAATVRVELEADLAIWPGDVLADLTHHCFYRAQGLRDGDLAPLRTGRTTLAALASWHGRRWVEAHILRLCLLGLARLRAGGPDGGS